MILSLSEERLISEKHAVTSARSIAAARSGFRLIRLISGSFLMAIGDKMKSKRQWVTSDKRFNGFYSEAATTMSHFPKPQARIMIKSPAPPYRRSGLS